MQGLKYLTWSESYWLRQIYTAIGPPLSWILWGSQPACVFDSCTGFWNRAFKCSGRYLQVVVEQKAVLYQSTNDWFCYKTVHEEMFDNHDDASATWSFNENISAQSTAQWTLIKALKSSKVLPLRLSLEYPVTPPGQEPLRVEFDCTRLSPASTSQSASRPATLRVSQDVTVDAYSASKVSAQLRVSRAKANTAGCLLYGQLAWILLP